MPVWPGVGRADDHRLLEALRRGGGTGAQAPAALYDAYADRLSDYAYALLGDLDAAARAVHDALVAASCSADRLTEPARLRAWLYALTRFHSATRRGKDGAGPVITVEESADPPLAALVGEALGELGDHEREALELALRHGLTTAEIGSVLGLAARQVSARLARARDHLENAAAALVLARTGRAHCPGLSALVDHGVGAAWQDGPLAAPLRKRLSRHIAGCEVCREGRGRHVSAARLLDMIPIAFPPLSLRGRVIESALRTGPRDGATAVLDRRGFPAAAQPPARARRGRARSRPLRTAPVMLAAVCVFGTAGGLALVSGQGPAERLEAIRVPPTAAPGNPTPGDPAPGDLVLGPEESDPPPDDRVTPAPTDTATPQDDPPPLGRDRPAPHHRTLGAVAAVPHPYAPRTQAGPDGAVPRRPGRGGDDVDHAGRTQRRDRVDGQRLGRDRGLAPARQAPRGGERPGRARRRRSGSRGHGRGDLPVLGGPALLPGHLGRPGGDRRCRPGARPDLGPPCRSLGRAPGQVRRQPAASGGRHRGESLTVTHPSQSHQLLHPRWKIGTRQ
ncbi:sigma factor-like helix-turn-helix DNA-binding protein [Microbispora sp. ZYX-F-249]|uniref:Sigma factor-like helix-turn-helix DNA-binding protein n=1 Tax=Microbispora maris TaxID=3144104 RepID=A0ABV0AZM2_9ACTN